jgi:hypothetical protein
MARLDVFLTQSVAGQMEVEAGIPLAQRVYCPKASCSTLFVGPDDEDGDGCAVCAAGEHVLFFRYPPPPPPT